MTRVAVFIQTGVLSPYPVALLAAKAPSLFLACSYLPTLLQFSSLRQAVCISISEKKILWTPVVVATPPPSSVLILPAGAGLMGCLYPPPLLTFPSRSARKDSFLQEVLSATSAASFKIDLPGAPLLWPCLHSRALPQEGSVSSRQHRNDTAIATYLRDRSRMIGLKRKDRRHQYHRVETELQQSRDRITTE